MTSRAKNYILFTLLLSFSCTNSTLKEADGFQGLSEPLNYTIKNISVKEYPEIIDSKILSFSNKNFPDSLLAHKKVNLVQRVNFQPGTKNVDFIDTAGYNVIVTNDSLELYWFIDFDSTLKTTRIEEMTFEKHQLFLKEGEEMKKKLKH